MGSCCTTNYEKNLEVKNNFEHIETETNNIIANLTKSELKFEQINYEISDEDIELGKIINKLKYLYKEKIKVFTEIELINLAIYSKENSDNDYLIFDMRLSLEQKENYLKKIKHINYTFDQIRNIKKINKYELLQNFIDNKDIIIITAKKYLSPQYKKDKNENEDYTIEICNLLYIINNNIQFKLLNSCLDKPEKKKDKFVNYLSLYYSYDFLPYILFTYKHVTTFYKEGYFFINFTNELLFNINKYIKVLNEINNEEHQEKYSDRLNEENVKYKFLNDMSVTTIINIDNELKTSFDIKEKDYKRNSFKEIFLNKNDLNIEMNKISELILWMKKEILRGHSCYFNIVNYDVNFLENDAQDNNWIFIIIFILLMVTEVEYFEVINYLKEKMIYFDEIEQVLNESINKEEIIELITKYKSF
jgi:hypothetical protein